MYRTTKTMMPVVIRDAVLLSMRMLDGQSYSRWETGAPSTMPELFIYRLGHQTEIDRADRNPLVFRIGSAWVERRPWTRVSRTTASLALN